MAVTKEEVLDYIDNMTVLELSELVKELEEKFGVSAAVLIGAGDKKIQVIKVVRSITSLGLKEAKALVDEAPKPVKEGITKEEAETVKSQLEEVGAEVEVK